VAAADGSVAPRVTQIAFKNLTNRQDNNHNLDDPEKGLPKTFSKPLQKQILALLRRQ
jgi:hypothetical protein